MSPPAGLSRIRLLTYRYRRPLAAGSAGLAVLLTLSVLRPAAPPTIDVLVAATDLPPGATITASDITTRAVSPDTIGLTNPDQVIGHMLATGIAAQEPITTTRLATGVGASALASGETAVPIRLADAALAEFLQPGDVIDLVSADDVGGQIIAEAVRVITIPRQDSSGFLSGSNLRASSLLLVAVPRRAATEVAASALRGPLAAVVRSRGGNA